MEVGSPKHVTLIGETVAIICFAVLFVLASGLSLTWLVLILLGLGTLAVGFWSPDLKNFLLYVYFLTLPVDLTKALAVPSGTYSPGLWLTLSDLPLIPLILLWLFDKKVVRGERLPRSGLHTIAVLNLAWCWVGAFLPHQRLVGVLAAIGYTKYYLAFLVISDFVRTPQQWRTLLQAVGLGLAVQVTMVVLQFVTNSRLEIQGEKLTTVGTRLVFEGANAVHAFRPSGFLHHPNVLADYLVFLLPTLLAFALIGRRVLGRRAWIVSMVLLAGGFSALMISLSRGGWLAFGAAAAFLLSAAYRRGVVSRRRLAGLAVAAAISIVLVALIYPTVYYRVTKGDEKSTQSRIEMIEQAALIISRHPLIGVGLGSYNSAAQTNIPASFANLNHWYRNELLKGVVHNKYLLVMAEQGAVGLMLFVLMLWRFTRALLAVSWWPDRTYAALGLGLTSALVGQATFYMFDHFYADVRISMLWSVMGLVAALKAMQDRNMRAVAVERNGASVGLAPT